MPSERPDLSGVDPAILAYIESLEAELERHSRGRARQDREEPEFPPLEPSEPATTINIITLTASGVAKRTPRHLYSRQHRGGMGIFDLDTNEKDPPAILTAADAGQSLLIFTSQARAFRLPISAIPETAVNGRGQPVTGKMSLLSDERLVAALPDQAKGSLVFVSQRGMVRLLRHHLFGDYMKPGTAVFDPKHFGPLCAATRVSGESDLLIVTRQGRAIRFPLHEKQIPPHGGPGIRLEEGDVPVAVAAVNPESGVFLLAADGRGSIRLMSGFNPNKSAGGGGKIAIAADRVVGAVTVEEGDDLFIISHLSKMIRFPASEIPPKEGVVQGVNCMALRADETAAVTTGRP